MPSHACFLYDFWGSNPGPLACKVSTLSIKSSPNPSQEGLYLEEDATHLLLPTVHLRLNCHGQESNFWIRKVWISVPSSAIYLLYHLVQATW